MSYVIAAYGVTAVVLIGYALYIARERSALQRDDDAHSKDS